MKCLIFTVSKYALWLLYGYKFKLHELTIYKKSPVENASLSFWVCLFFQYFDRKIIDTLRNIVELYK